MRLSLIVVEGNGPSLLGRDWMERLVLSCCQLNQVQQLNEIECVLAHHSNVFKEELGLVKRTQARIYIESGTSPRYFRARPLPFALRGKVEQELTRLQEQGVIEPVQFSDWAAPVVPVVKSDGTIRLCGDYKVTINQASKIDKHPLPRIDDLLSSLTDGLSPNEKKVQAIKAAPRPVDVSQLRSFLGLVNYYGKFLPNIASTLAPLYLLLQRKTGWKWGIDQSPAFERAKGLLTF